MIAIPKTVLSRGEAVTICRYVAVDRAVIVERVILPFEVVRAVIVRKLLVSGREIFVAEPRARLSWALLETTLRLRRPVVRPGEDVELRVQNVSDRDIAFEGSIVVRSQQVN